MTSRPFAHERGGIDGAQAWEASLASPYAVWDRPPDDEHFAAGVRGRLASGPALPHVAPKFQLRADDVFFCIGSCFARVLEVVLLLHDLTVSSLGLRGDLAEAPDLPNGVVNKFTTASMLNELHWSLGGRPFPEEALIADGDGYRDLQLAAARAPVTGQRARERRRDVIAYFARLRTRTSSFGLNPQRRFPEFNEAWYLAANPDVKAAIMSGEFSSGYEHWLRTGSAQGRPLGAASATAKP